MRAAFASEIEVIAENNDKVVLLSGDIGNRMFDTFKDKFPDRFYNCGVAEANMTGLAAGLALCDFIPVTYTITAFNTLRCLEQIRLDVCYQNLPVVIVGVGGGLSYASLNATHHALEDIACLRAIPNMTVICPGDPSEVRAAIQEAIKLKAPVYIRMAKKNEPQIHDSYPNFEIGKAITMKEGKDICILNCGSLLPSSLEAAEILRSKNISAEVVNMHTVKPLDEITLIDIFNRFSHVFTIEEHSILGGFGGSVAEWLTDQQDKSLSKLSRIGTSDKFMYEAGEKEHAQSFFKITPQDISSQILEALDLR